jgi:hypothetical protein
MTDEATDPAAPRVPKYKAPDFMRKEIELFHRARYATTLLRRYGDNDEPVPAVAPLLGINAIRSVTEINRNIR